MKAVVLAILVCVAPGLLQAQEPLVRSSISAPADDLWVGQRATLVVTLLAPGFFSGTPTFDLPTVSGLLVLPSQGSPLIGSEQIGDASYTSQRWEFPVFAQRAGGFEIPPIQVRFAYKKNPLDTDPVESKATAPGQKLTAKLPPGAAPGETLLSASDLKVVETWDREPGGKARLGDAFSRTITYSATDIPGMAFPEFSPGTIEGMGVYRKTPSVSDQSERGQLTGHRQDTVVYVCERGGTFVLPGYRFRWWNVRDKQMETIEFPERSIQVEASRAKSSPKVSYLTLAGLFSAAALIFLFRKGIGEMAVRIVDVFWPVHLSSLNP